MFSSGNCEVFSVLTADSQTLLGAEFSAMFSAAKSGLWRVSTVLELVTGDIATTDSGALLAVSSFESKTLPGFCWAGEHNRLLS